MSFKFLYNPYSKETYSELTDILLRKDIQSWLVEHYSLISVPIPEIMPMVGFNQKSKFHPYDVWKHTAVVVANTPKDEILRWAALFHDIGKPDCFSIDELGRGHFYGHDVKSAEIADKIMARLSFDTAIRERVRLLVAQHKYLMCVTISKKFAKRMIAKFGIKTAKQIVALRKADLIGHTKNPKEMTKCEQVETFLYEIEKEEREESSKFTLKQLAVNGNDLIALEYSGRSIGLALSFLLDAVVTDKIENDKHFLLEYLKHHFRLDK